MFVVDKLSYNNTLWNKNVIKILKNPVPGLVFNTQKNTNFAKLHFFTIFQIRITNLRKKLAKKTKNSKTSFDLLMQMKNV